MLETAARPLQPLAAYSLQHLDPACSRQISLSTGQAPPGSHAAVCTSFTCQLGTCSLKTCSQCWPDSMLLALQLALFHHVGATCLHTTLLQILWPSLVQRHGGKLAEGFDLSTLTHVSEGYSSGTIDQVCRGQHAQACPTPCTELPLHIHTAGAAGMADAVGQQALALVVPFIFIMLARLLILVLHAAQDTLHRCMLRESLAPCRWCAAC